jgi:flagellar biosynthetic protein FliR
MINLFHWSSSEFQSLILIMIRVSTVLFMMPVLNPSNLPVMVKVGLTLTVSLVLWPVVKWEASSLPSEPYAFGFFMISEFMIGFLLGLSIRLIFAAIQLAGEFAGFQMGFAMASIIDPQSGLDTTLLAQFYYLLGLLIFLSIDGHHWFFRALVQSFHLLSPGEFYPQERLYLHLLNLSGRMFLIAIEVVAPVTAILFLTQLVLGIVARMVPQVNILISSFPLTISLGLIFLGLSMEFLGPYLQTLFDESGKGLVMTLLPLMKR